MISVERQLPRNSKIIMPVKTAAMMASRTTAMTDAWTKPDWSLTAFNSTPAGNVSLMPGSNFLTPSIMSSVDAEPVFKIVIRTALRPSN